MTAKTFLIYGTVVCLGYAGLTFSKVAVIDPSPGQQLSGRSGGGHAGGGGGYSGGGYRWPDTGYHK